MYDGYNFHSVKSGSLAASAVNQKVLPCLTAQGQAVVAAGNTSAVPLAGRRMIEVTNEDATNQIRVGDNTIAVGLGGRMIPPKGSAQFWVTAEVALYVLADAGTPNTSWNEYA